MAHQRGHRNPGDMEVGINDVFIHVNDTPHLAERPAAPQWLTTWESRRPTWLMEMICEAFGVALYCWSGLNATATFFVSSAAKETGFGSLQTIAFCYALGIMMAVIFCGPTSGAHLSPGVTISFAIFKGFPWRKVPQYIFAQLVGGFVGCIFVYLQFKTQLDEITALMEAAGEHAAIFTPSGPAGVLALFMNPGYKIGFVFLNEFVACLVFGTVVFSVLDPSNHFVTPSSAPPVIGFTFFVLVSSLGMNGIALNSARDLGGRFAAGVVWGSECFPPAYTALAALTNILAFQIGALFQILFLSDTIRQPTAAAMVIHHAQTAEKEAHLQRVLTSRTDGNGGLSRVLTGGLKRTVTPKPEVAHYETKNDSDLSTVSAV